MSTYVVGDIQGCYQALNRLLDKIGFAPGTDQLWCVGDLVNRGPDSLKTLRFLHRLGDDVRVVLGNHDLHFIAVFESCAGARSSDSLRKLLNAPDCQQLSDWLRQQPLALHDCLPTESGLENFLMVHAGVAPRWSLQKTLNLAAEVELALQGRGRHEYLRNMYGNEPIRWYDKLEGPARLRTITNYLTRLRFCDDIGSLRLDIKEGLCAAPVGFRPWFDYEKITPQATILFGHWAALEGYTGKSHVYALDTGCVWGRRLTALRLEDKRLYSVAS